VVAGIDGTPWQDVRIGAAVGFSSQNISATNAASYRGNAVQLQVYGSARYAIAFLDVQAGGVFTEGTARRTVSAYCVAPGGDISGFGGGASVRGGLTSRSTAGIWSQASCSVVWRSARTE